VTVACPSSSGFSSPNPFGSAAPQTDSDFSEDFDMNVPLTYKDLGIPEEIRLIGPDLPREIFIRGIIPDEITIKGDIPRSIEVHSDIPHKIMLDATDVPRKIMVEMAPNFPSTLRMDVTHTLQVTGIPKSIEIIENIPRTIQLLMPENPVVELKFNQVDIELKPSADLEKMFSNLMIPLK
jgi:hypothetical protein